MSDSEEKRLDEKVDLHELMVRGNDYRDTREFTILGYETEVVMKPMPDEVNVPLTLALHQKFGMEVEDAREEVEESRDEAGDIDVSELDDEFIGLMKRAARHSIDREKNGWTEEEFTQMVGTDPTAEGVDETDSISVGGAIIELGMEGLELAGTMEDAELFRGKRQG